MPEQSSTLCEVQSINKALCCLQLTLRRTHLFLGIKRGELVATHILCTISTVSLVVLAVHRRHVILAMCKASWQQLAVFLLFLAGYKKLREQLVRHQPVLPRSACSTSMRQLLLCVTTWCVSITICTIVCLCTNVILQCMMRHALASQRLHK